MKFTICDDTASDLSNLESILKSYANTNNCSIEIEKNNNPETLLKRVEFNPEEYKVLFLDIVMQQNGNTTAKMINELFEDKKMLSKN